MGSLIQLDHVLRTWVVLHRVGALDGVMWTFSAIGRGGAVFAVIALALTIARRRARDFVQVGLALALASVIADSILKPAVDRQRPYVTTPEVHVIGGRPDDASFPSGHTANAFAGAATLSWVAPGGTIAWWTLAVAIAYSRVYVGVHYPLDVIGGAIVGLVAAIAVSVAYARIGRGRRLRPEQ